MGVELGEEAKIQRREEDGRSEAEVEKLRDTGRLASTTAPTLEDRSARGFFGVYTILCILLPLRY